MKLVVIGGGNLPLPGVSARLTQIHNATPITRIIAGPDALDALAWAQARGIPVFARPETWDVSRMPSHADKADAILAFVGPGVDAPGAVQRATAVGIVVLTP